MSKNNNKETKQCTSHGIMRWFGFSGHKWKYDGVIRTCKKCGETQRLIDYEAFYTIWRKI